LGIITTMATTREIQDRLAAKGLKVTPQRIAILDAIYSLNNHPTAERIIDFVRKQHPAVAIGTVYSVLETLVANNLVKKVTTDRDIMRYDGILEGHHHLYCNRCDRIHDYVDEELNKLISDFFKHKKIDGFKIEEFVLQIKGTYDECRDS